MSSSQLLHTPLVDWHQAQGAKMVPFAGYQMPVQYTDGILKEHLHTRAHAGLFDVSHMGQIWLSGEGVVDFLERVTPADVAGLDVGEMRYGLLLNAEGGVIDDLMMVKMDERAFWLVVNAARVDEDVAHLLEYIPPSVALKSIKDRALVALQGPEAVKVLAAINPDVEALRFMQADKFDLDGVECWISRSGYTGEDGFELSIPAADVKSIVSSWVEDERVKPAGLGARDSLRLEAGLPLYGNELNEETTPIDSGLRWAIGKPRRVDGARAGGFIGADAVLAAMEHGSKSKLIGLIPEGRAILRTGARIYAGDTDVGVVTSGVFSPSLEQPIALALVNVETASETLTASLRGKSVALESAKLPFVPHRYVRA